MELKQFTQEKEEEIVALWNRCCVKDQMNLEKFRQQALYDDNFDETLVWTAQDQDRVIGFIMATKRKFPYMERGLESERGWINVMFVDEKVRRNKVGTKLLKTAEQELKRRGAKNITLGAYSPNYFFPGIDEDHYEAAAAFFRKHHYQPGDLHYSMEMSLDSYQIPEDVMMQKEELEKEGYQFIRFKWKYSLELLNFLKREFGGGWKRNALIAMREKTAEDVILLALNPEQKICGFCMRAIDGNQERFGPIGVSKNERNAKLGSVLLHLQMKCMKEAGCRRMFFMTTDENGRRFYQRNGLKIIRKYKDYRKKLDE